MRNILKLSTLEILLLDFKCKSRIIKIEEEEAFAYVYDGKKKIKRQIDLRVKSLKGLPLKTFNANTY